MHARQRLILTASFAVLITAASAQQVSLNGTFAPPAADPVNDAATITPSYGAPSYAAIPAHAGMVGQPLMQAPAMATGFVSYSPAYVPQFAYAPMPPVGPTVPDPALMQPRPVMPNPEVSFQPVSAAAAGTNPFLPREAVAMPSSDTASAAMPYGGMVQQVPPSPAAGPAANATAAPPVPQLPAPAPFSLDLPSTNTAGEPPVAAMPKKEGPDVGALRYYAQQRDLKRVGAEIRRLKSHFPDWEAPADLFSPSEQVDEQPMWDIYATGNYAGVRQLIARTQQQNAQWQPSLDLSTKLTMGEMRGAIDRAHKRRNWFEVISLAQKTPSILVCSEMNVLWSVAEALAGTRDYARAFEVYKYILTYCDNSHERVSTLQKAKSLLPQTGVTALVGLGRMMADGTFEFEDIGFDQLRSRMSRIAEGNGPIGTASQEELAAFAEFVQRHQSAGDAALFGWYFYGLEEWEAARAWFSVAQGMEPSAKSIEGIILTVRNMGDYEQAMELAMVHRGRSPELTKVLIELGAASLTSDEIDFAFSSAEFEVFESAVRQQESALGAQAVGWRYVTQGDLGEAKEWFRQSVAWEANEGGVIGLAVIASRRKDNAALADLKSRYGGDYAGLTDFTVYRTATASRPARQRSQLASAPSTREGVNRSTRERELEEKQSFRRFLYRVLNSGREAPA